MAMSPQVLAEPTVSDDLSRFDVHPDDLPRRTRRSTLTTAGMDTDIPPGMMPEGWVCAWFAFAVYNEPVETWQTTLIADGGWEPVPAKLVLDRQKRLGHRILPDEWSGATVERGGQRLYMRPEYLDKESRREDIARTRQQSSGRLDAARIDDPRAPHVVGMQTHDETFVRPGVHGIDALAAEAEMTRQNGRAARAAQDPLGGSLRTSADDIPAEERAEIAQRHMRGGRVKLD